MLTLGTAVFAILAVVIVLVARQTFLKPQATEKLISKAIPPAAPLTQPLPSTWYKSDDIYELERRAIFSKKWILLTHQMRFTQTGAWVRFAEAGFDFFLIRNAEGVIRGFHNICRHRAFPVVVKETGQNNVLSCKYHGWSYGMNGQLAKAPLYQDLPGFDRSKNGLFPLHVHVDSKGFIWVNMDAKAKPENAWTESQAVNTQSLNLEDYQFDHVKEDNSSLNWKTLVDKYSSNANDATENEKKGTTLVNDFYFPNASMTISPHFFFLLRCVPTSATKSSLQYEVYRHKRASDSDFNKVEDILNQTTSEQESFSSPAEKNLRAGVLVDQTPLAFQNQVYQAVEHHRKLEGVAGREIRPAQQILDKSATKTEQDESLYSSCSGLSCGKIAKDLSW